MITIKNFEDVLKTLEFEAEGNTYQKSIGEATLKVDIDKKELIYPEGLEVNEGHTCNFSQNENFVVFECVYQLVNKGYKPEHLELEPKWKVGHGASGGRADILVRDHENNPLLLIECKTAGEEFERAWRKTLQNGDQLFSYAQQIPQTQYLCLYASDLVDDKIRIDQRIIAHRDNEKILAQNDKLRPFADATDVDDRYAVWRDTYEREYTEAGIFEPNIQPYQIGKNKYTLENDTEPIDADDKEGQYHKFRTILRQHNIARREQAFEVLVNLFLCKLVDEEDNKTDLQFSWKGIAYDNYFDFVDRLQNLYKTGMNKFLGKEISYISNEQIDKAFWAVRNDSNATKKQIQKYFRELKFYTNSAFSLMDTHNEDLFKRNAKVLLELVQMWQKIRLKTVDQNQFLGEMFELFLDDGVKQSEGQFFTPLPICKFIVGSLPLRQKIEENTEPLKAIDFACGSGHFLNEYAHQIMEFVEKQNRELYYSHITGIEKEDRLAKVAKVAAYMHRQEQIKILDIDALADQPEITKESFDVLVANPPFAVDGFLHTLSKDDKQQYQLIQATGEDSDTNTIQCFFLERIHHLMVSKGVVGVIVPSSILSNADTVHIRTREILLQFFDIVSIVQLGSGTFGKTGTNTVVLFLKRKEQRPEPTDQYRNRVKNFFEGDEEKVQYQDHDLIQAYCKHIDIPYEEYIKLFNQTNLDPLTELLEHDIFKDYEKDFNPDKELAKIEKSKEFRDKTDAEQLAELGMQFINYLHDKEKDKLHYFMLAHTQDNKVLIVEAPNDKKEQKTFLGYEWSKAKGREGIKYIGGDTVNDIITPLFDPKNLDNDEKINTAIKRSFIGDPTDELPEHCYYANLTDMLNFTRIKFNKAISLNPKLQPEVLVPALMNSCHQMKDIDRVLTLEYGISLPENNRVNGDYPVYGSNGVVGSHNEFLVNAPCIIVGRKGSVGQVNWSEKDCTPIDTTFYVKLLDESTTDLKFTYYMLKSLNLSSLRVGSGPGGINRNNVYGLQIPLPPIEIQQQIVDECEAVDQETDQAREAITTAKQEIEKKLQAVVSASSEIKKLGDIADIKSGGTPSRKNDAYWENGLIPWLRSEVCKETHINKNIDYECITEEGLNNSSAKWLASDTTLIALVGATKGKTAFLTFEATTNQNIAGIKSLSKNILDIYIFYCLKSLYNRITQDLSQYDMLNLTEIKNIRIPVPPLNIQQQLAAEVERLEAKVTEAQAVIDKATERKNAILTKYL